MLLARRKFIQSGLLFGATAFLFHANGPSGFGRTLADELPDEALSDPLIRFTRETFEPYVGGYFEAADARGVMVPMKLVKVESYDPKTDTKISNGRPVDTDSFSLQFNAEGPLSKFQTIYQIKHGALGDFRLFLTRRDVADRQIVYEAVFNRLS